MSTLADLRTSVSRALRDPDNRVFTTNDVTDMVNAALAEIGRIAPARFLEVIDPVENEFNYTLQSTVFDTATPEIEVSRVEIWDVTTTPYTPRGIVPPASAGYTNYSNTGWALRDGVLELPYSTVKALDGREDDFQIKVWGYRPYAPLSADEDASGLSHEREEALKVYCWMEALRRLNIERDLFTQWQTRAGNSDVSPAGLMNMYSLAREEWRQKARAITVLREVAG